ncbi:hypothetical protein GGR58DRAFT_514046 [Xylaria digitata]|nr:hypothetical protein GGR58DRAFT_514046 [Xylaria digitata]
MTQKSKASGEQKARKIVVKYSFGSLSPDKKSNADDDLRNEYQWLKRLRGAEHIGQLIDMADCSLNIPGISNGEDTHEDSLKKNREKEDAGKDEPQPTATAPARRCPTFALEYIPYGTVFDLHMTLYRSRQLWVPSRLLWKIWLCMVRQCIAMAYPPDIPDDQYVGQIIREVIQDKPPASICQNSPHTQNFMLGAAQLPGNEHEPNLPVVKLIDFGRGKLEVGETAQRRLPDNIEEYASRRNLYGAAQAMSRMCSVHTVEGEDYDPRDDPVPYTWTDDSGTHTIQTRAPEVLITNAIVDPQLKNLLIRIMAWPWSDKPSLREVLNETEAAVNKDPDHPGLLTENAKLLGVLETDDILNRFVQHWLYDAP